MAVTPLTWIRAHYSRSIANRVLTKNRFIAVRVAIRSDHIFSKKEDFFNRYWLYVVKIVEDGILISQFSGTVIEFERR